MKQKTIIFTEAYKAELLEDEIPVPGPGQVRVKLAISTISSGTERANLVGDVNVSIARNASPVPVFPRRSGYSSAGVVDMALAAKEAGCTLVCITSLEASPRLAPKHPCGKRLFELGDYVLDNCTPYGDAMLEVEGVEYKCFPGSGIGAAYTLWAMIACATESLLVRGISPTMLCSANVPDGMKVLEGQHARYQELGY